LNLSDLTGGWLRDEGVATYGELCEADLVQLFHALKATHKQVSRLMYYALVGAVLNIHWNQIPEEERTREL
jgi:DNA transformation protein